MYHRMCCVCKVDITSAVQTSNINDYDNEIKWSTCPLICILSVLHYIYTGCIVILSVLHYIYAGCIVILSVLHYIYTGCTKYFVLGLAWNAFGTKEYKIGKLLGFKFIL